MHIVHGDRKLVDCERAFDAVDAMMLAKQPDAVNSIRIFFSLAICYLCLCSWTFSQSLEHGRAIRNSMDHLKIFKEKIHTKKQTNNDENNV